MESLKQLSVTLEQLFPEIIGSLQTTEKSIQMDNSSEKIEELAAASEYLSDKIIKEVVSINENENILRDTGTKLGHTISKVIQTVDETLSSAIPSLKK
ncbi:uncharacterized protein MONOS_9524 [Monocercomonoides exilis]|uniref:uncharacterized protein n=1 Tax=Monocercomonoides exilis TaxID=2049356 RepID=UPI00355A9994|nr:hypothetical protein MONOS_9524 [Monocercomonoides exilis]|eukprot:MONOS_9524.1-p1 / transcript=MONOS_9524.1 / gene=MONOS_9524 / organism=Monocercomonoides_exilis_PA203 / gene_product=unspecified product / transcript_product=unspecified product / location=Mono_scaffold00396:30572-30923(+) / protein_length=98 / sequence_SO=supercontig / SO=protein_coding / is_pseudo=false